MNKFQYIYVIKTNYGYGWEDECWYDSKETTLQQVKKDAREYGSNRTFMELKYMIMCLSVLMMLF